jgi:L-cysteine S-thiosulfotransferase
VRFLLAAFIVVMSPVHADERRSGYSFMTPETRAMQDDDSVNPATLWVLDGEALWQSLACAGCHADMKGVAARYPKVDAQHGLINLEQRINTCRTENQKAAPFAYESRELLALAAFIGRQSRGLPIDIKPDERTKPYIEAGRATFFRRQGQLNLACTQCHDQQWGKTLLGNPIPQAHPTGYPVYRLEWQGLGSLQRRLRNCYVGVRAEPSAYGAKEFVELELYLMWRANGMKVETPAVRP